jgi:hypothetical protein
MKAIISFSFFLRKPTPFGKSAGFTIAFLVVLVVIGSTGCVSDKAKTKSFGMHERLSSQEELSEYARNYRKSVEGTDEIKSTGSLFFPSARAREIDKNLGGQR